MGLISELSGLNDQQTTLSSIQQAAKAFGQSGVLDPQTAQLIQENPRLGLEAIPQLIQRNIQMSALSQLGGSQQGSQQPSASAPAPSALQQYGSSGDQDPGAPVPQALPNMTQPQMQPSAPTAQQQNPALAQLRQAIILGNGDLGKGLTALKAQRELTVPGGIGAIPEGQQYVNGQLQPIPGAVSKADQEVDKNFADSWQTYNNAGGSSRVQQSLNVIDQTIQDLKDKKITTGGPIDRLAMEHGEPSTTGALFDAPVLVARNQVASAILPQAKALFGSRVTNFDAQSIVNSKGLDPMADTQTNIDKLERLKTEIGAGQEDLQNSGNYFQQHHTLSGYQKPTSISPTPNSQSSSSVNPLVHLSTEQLIQLRNQRANQ